jgi:cobyrinic acid a,c-diamide synthase
VIFNRVGGEKHRAVLEGAAEAALPALARLGALRRETELHLPERHLGLVQARERPDLDAMIDRAANAVAAAVDLGALVALARPAHIEAAAQARALPPLAQRIAVADDDAFAFAYPAMLAGWRAAGAEIVPFSPLADESPDAAADAVFLPGGYPELHAGRLAGNRRFLDGLRAAAARGAVVYGECGGYMVLGRTLTDAGGGTHAMAGLLPLQTSFAARRLALGYRSVKLAAATPLGPAGTGYRGHEFHYATATDKDGDPLFEALDALDNPLGPTGHRVGAVMGSFIHLIDHNEAAQP